MARQIKNSREREEPIIRKESPLDPPMEQVIKNFVGNTEISKNNTGKVTSVGGGNFPSKYPEVLSSVANSVSNFHKTFTEKETYSAVTVNHTITNKGAVGTFCTYLIDGSSDTISGDDQWRSYTVNQDVLESLKVGNPPTTTPEEPSKETPAPTEVVAAEAPKPVGYTPPSTTNTTPTPGAPPRETRRPISRGRGRSRTTPTVNTQSGVQQGYSSTPTGAGRYPFETKNFGGSIYAWRPLRGNQGYNRGVLDRLSQAGTFNTNAYEWVKL